MRIARVIGNATLNESHPSFLGASFKLVMPLMLDQLASAAETQAFMGAEILVAWDEFAAGVGSLVAISEGPEAARPFRPQFKPVDAYVAAILDDASLVVEPLNTAHPPSSRQNTDRKSTA